MGIFDKLFNKPVERPVGNDRKMLFQRVNPYKQAEDVYKFAMFTRDYSQMNQQPAGRKKLKQLFYDPCIHNVTNTRLDGLCDLELKVITENEATREFIEDQLAPHKDTLLRGSVWSVFLGYNVFELIWQEENGRASVRDIIIRDTHNFEPLLDGISVVFNDILGMYRNDATPEPYGKYLLAVNEGCAENPWGVSLFQTLHYISKVKNYGLRSWAKWLERFGNPFLLGKTCPDEEHMNNMLDALDGAVDAASIVIDDQSEITVLDGSGGSQGGQFKQFEDCLRMQIHQAVLGQNLTTEVTGGSFAAANVHNEIRQDKIKADKRLAEQTIAKLVDYIKFYNNITEDIQVQLKFKDGIDMSRAQRDAILVNAGIVSLSEDYLLERYDFEEGDFQLPQVNETFFSRAASKANLTIEKEQREIDEMVEVLLDQGLESQDAEELWNAIQASENKSELIANLAELAQTPNTSLETLMTQAMYFAFRQGVEKIG